MEEINSKYKATFKKFMQGKFSSIYEASKSSNLSYSSLHRYITKGDEQVGA